ncbi:hypothetical protein EUGRSUZ_A01069 [Eucalyptus grandis]|uniref:Uncharacterized protein n=2 Tax=Eucalyptus grandis TaxID=71139 RepID=A0ACC3M3Z4_EUCGR|nr:hypothetical protein EUGRSUZ_A01069 [Eucalyptus grandis]
MPRSPHPISTVHVRMRQAREYRERGLHEAAYDRQAAPPAPWRQPVQFLRKDSSVLATSGHTFIGNPRALPPVLEVPPYD